VSFSVLAMSASDHCGACAEARGRAEQQLPGPGSPAASWAVGSGAVARLVWVRLGWRARLVREKATIGTAMRR